MKLPFLRKKPKAPNSPITGEDGRSARQRCFDLYDRGVLPAEVADKVGIRKDTARRYRSQWVNMNPGIKRRYEILRKLILLPQGREILFVVMTGSLGLSEAEAGDMLGRPSELIALISSRWPTSKGEDDLYVSLERAWVAVDIVRFLEDTGWDLKRARKDIPMILKDYIRRMSAERAMTRERRAPRQGNQETSPDNPEPPGEPDMPADTER